MRKDVAWEMNFGMNMGCMTWLPEVGSETETPGLDKMILLLLA